MEKAISKVIVFILVSLLLVPFISGCSNSSEANKYIGEWVEVNKPSERAKVVKTNKGYIWEDSDGKFPAKMEKGKLKINTFLGEAVAYYDQEQKSLIVLFLGQEVRYVKAETLNNIERQNEEIAKKVDSEEDSSKANENSVIQFVGYTINVVNKTIRKAEIQENSCYITPEIVLHGYYYDATAGDFYAFIKYNNPSKDFKLPNDTRIQLVFYTDEGQRIEKEVYLATKSNFSIPGGGSVLEFTKAAGVTSIPIKVIVDEKEIELTSTETLVLEPIILPADPIYPKIDVVDTFRELSKQHDHLKELSAVENATIEKMTYTENGIEMALTLTLNKYISPTLFEGGDYDLFFTLVSDKNEGVRGVSNIAIGSDRVRGLPQVEQLPANKPFTLKLYFNPMMIEAQSFKFHVQYYRDLNTNSFGGPKHTLFHSLSKNGFSIRNGAELSFQAGQHDQDDESGKKPQQTAQKDKGSETLKIEDFTIESSSNLSEDINGKKIVHKPHNLIDNDKGTAWVEGIKGSGVGEWVKFQNEEEVLISSLALINGYAKSDDLYNRNSRVKEILVEFSNGKSVKAQLSDGLMDFQEIALEEPVRTNTIKFTIIDTYPGSKHEDTCISEIIIR